MRYLNVAIVAAYMLIPWTASAADVLDASRFTQYVKQRLERTQPSTRAEIVAPLQIKSTGKSEVSRTSFLENLYARYQANPTAIDALVDEHLASLGGEVSIPTSVEAASLRLVIKPGQYIETAKKQFAAAGLGDKPFPMHFNSVGGDLYAFYVFDGETGMRYVGPQDLDRLKLSPDALQKIALANTAKHIRGSNYTVTKLPDDKHVIFRVTVDQNYDASAVMIPDLWRGKLVELKGDPVVFVPARNVMLVSGSKDIESTTLAMAIARKISAESAYSISASPYIYRNGLLVKVGQ